MSWEFGSRIAQARSGTSMIRNFIFASETAVVFRNIFNGKE